MNKKMNIEKLKNKYEYADIFTVSEWVEDVNNGRFSEYDGHGHWLDKNGNIINHDLWNEYIPENACFVIWYNK